MQLPDTLQQQIKAAFDEMQAHSQHTLSPFRRNAIYTALGSASNPVADRARGWLGVQTAHKVLPLWEAAFPLMLTSHRARYGDTDSELQDYNTPQAGIAAVEGMLRGTVERRELSTAQGGEYYGWTGAALGYYPWVPLNAWWVAVTVERIGPFRGLFTPFGIHMVTPQDSDDEGPRSPLDAAAAALRAYTAPDSPVGRSPRVARDLRRYYEFWQWWLIEAVPHAWLQAQSESF